MAEHDTNRKRSRSPSDSEHEKQQHKRANTGAGLHSDDIPAKAQPTAAAADTKPAPASLPPGPSSAAVLPNDVTMADSKDFHVDDTAASTPHVPNNDLPKREDDNDEAASSSPADAMANAANSGQPSSSSGPPPPPPPSAHIHMRCLIVTQDASIIIGKAGSHVNEIREKSGARVMVSESIPGNPERILNVSGPLDAVSKVFIIFSHLTLSLLFLTVLPPQAFGLIVRRINDEPFDVPSVPGSRAVTIKFMIPNSRMGSVIGKQGSKIKEIQDASGARLNASEGMLPGSTEVRPPLSSPSRT